MKNPIGWFEIYVDDMARAKAFYEKVLGITLEPLPDPSNSGIEMVAFPSNYEAFGATGSLVKMDGFPAGGNSTMVYFACDDCAVEEARVVDAGGKIHQTKMEIGDNYGFVANVFDSEGNMIGLHSNQ